MHISTQLDILSSTHVPKRKRRRTRRRTQPSQAICRTNDACYHKYTSYCLARPACGPYVPTSSTSCHSRLVDRAARASSASCHRAVHFLPPAAYTPRLGDALTASVQGKVSNRAQNETSTRSGHTKHLLNALRLREAQLTDPEHGRTIGLPEVVGFQPEGLGFRVLGFRV